MRDIKACRACLYTRSAMLVRINDMYRRIFESACGVVIAPNDGYPYYFCIECMAHIKRILTFRRKSRRADFVLKEIMTVQSEVSSKDIAGVDRRVTNLVSSLDVWKPQNIHIYTYNNNAEGGNQFVNDTIKYVNGIIRIQCSELDQFSDHDFGDTEGIKDFDDEAEDMGTANTEFDSVDNIVKKIGVDDTISDIAPIIDIDLNDVFKGLEEKLDSDDEMKKLEQEKAESIKNETWRERMERKRQKRQKLMDERRRLKEEKDRNRVHNKTSKSIACTLTNFEIELLNVEEQIRRHEEKWSLEPFKSSLFKCMVCVKIFDTVQLLIEHCEEHNKFVSAMYCCDVCNLRLDSEEDMAVHVSERHRYSYSCILCGDSIYDFNIAIQHKCMKKPLKDTDAELNDTFHMVPQTQEEMKAALKKTTGGMRCPVCKLAFTTYAAYKTHLDKHTKRPTSKSQCDICGVYYTSVNALTKHMAYWHQYLWQCKICSFVAPHRHRALDHLEDHKVASSGCPYCSKTSKTVGGMRFHIRKYHYKEIYSKICPLCGVAFSSFMFFYYHQMEKHNYIYLPHPPLDASPSKEWTCVHCNIEFLSLRALETHALLYGHEEAKDIPYACIPCKKIFDDQDSLDMHTSICNIHTSYPLPCRICGMKVTSATNYYHHCKKYHPTCHVRRGGKLCEQCGLTFAHTKWSQHLCRMKHKSFECVLCEKQFLTGRSYGLHMIYKHTDHPFHCALCPEKFKRRINAKDHILKVHAPCTPYTCSICHRQFAVLEYLKEHTSSSHGYDVIEDPKKIKRVKRHIFVYPHMKLNVSSIDKSRLNELKFQVRDYNDTILETIENNDCNKYLMFDVVSDKPEIKMRKRRSKSETTAKRKKMDVETVVIESGENLEIIEVDGKKYVTIDDVVYQIENQ